MKNEAILEIFSKYLSKVSDNIDISSNIMDVLNSIDFMRMIVDLEEEIKEEIDLEDVILNNVKTFEQLGKYIQKNS